MKIPERKDCIHSAICKYDDAMCPCECGYFEKKAKIVYACSICGKKECIITVDNDDNKPIGCPYTESFFSAIWKVIE